MPFLSSWSASPDAFTRTFGLGGRTLRIRVSRGEATPTLGVLLDMSTIEYTMPLEVRDRGQGDIDALKEGIRQTLRVLEEIRSSSKWDKNFRRQIAAVIHSLQVDLSAVRA